jgi:uncharacterized repeat protein (TIGR04076 family)
VNIIMSSEEDVVKIGDLWKEPISYKVSVIKEGYCRADHKEGEVFEFDWRSPRGICSESFVGMYPILHSLRSLGDMRELGSSHRNVRVYNCPGRVIQFQIEATYHCNLCGQTLLIEEGEVGGQVIENKEQNLHVRVCPDCFEKYKDKKLVW